MEAKARKHRTTITAVILAALVIMPALAYPKIKMKKLARGYAPVESVTPYLNNVESYLTSLNGQQMGFDEALKNPGTYYVTQINGPKVAILQFTVDENSNQLGTYDSFVNGPVFKESDEGLALFYENEANERVWVTFESNNGVFYNYSTKNPSIAAMYVFEDLPAKDYTMTVRAGKKTYTYDFSID